MDEERMVRLVIEEVLRLLNAKGLKQLVVKSLSKILVVFTGGLIGLQEALQALQELQLQGAELTVVLSPAAEKVIGSTRIRESLGKEVPVITAITTELYDLISHTDLVLVPVFTQNSLAKVVHLICDTVATEVILRALQFGKTVIASNNAADPKAQVWMQTGRIQAPEKLLHAMQENLRQVQEYGVELVAAQDLARAAQQALQPVVALPAQPAFMMKNNENAIHGKTVLSAMRIRQAASNGEHRLVVENGSLITPLAKDIAKDSGIEIVMMDH